MNEDARNTVPLHHRAPTVPANDRRRIVGAAPSTRMASAPITVNGLPLESVSGMKPSVSLVLGRVMFMVCVLFSEICQDDVAGKSGAATRGGERGWGLVGFGGDRPTDYGQLLRMSSCRYSACAQMAHLVFVDGNPVKAPSGFLVYCTSTGIRRIERLVKKMAGRRSFAETDNYNVVPAAFSP